MDAYFLEHKWDWCRMCGPHVVCGQRGNNACNGGYGLLPDGSKCGGCASAYDLQETGVVPQALAERAAIELNL